MPCLLRLDTIIVERSPICCSSAQTYGLVGQFGLNVDSPNITCYSCASLIACSTRLHLLLTCIYISLLCSRLCPPIRDEPKIALVEMSNSIWKPIPIQMVPKSKSIWQPEPIDLNNGNLLRAACRASHGWAKIHGGKRKKRLNLSLTNFWKQLATINLFKVFMPGESTK